MTDHEIAYKDWCENSKQYLADAEKWNKWRRESKAFLLTELGPRIQKLRGTGHGGSGFHYEMEISFGKLIVSMAYPWQPCANYCEKVKDQYVSNSITKVIFEGLVEQVEDAENLSVNNA